jgi:hypothetical protein
LLQEGKSISDIVYETYKKFLVIISKKYTQSQLGDVYITGHTETINSEAMSTKTRNLDILKLEKIHKIAKKMLGFDKIFEL